MRIKGFTVICILLIITSCTHGGGLLSQEQMPTKDVAQETETYITISCNERDTTDILKKIKNLPEDAITITIDLDINCKTQSIPDVLLQKLTQKPLYLVHWFPIFPNNRNNDDYYHFHDDEIEFIAKSPWKWLGIDHLTSGQYKILRNKKTVLREGFEPEGSPDFYTQKEREKCDFTMNSYSGSNQDILEKISEERIQCYKNLPPIE